METSAISAASEKMQREIEARRWREARDYGICAEELKRAMTAALCRLAR